MTDPRTLVEREIQRADPPPFTLDGFHRRRARGRRNERIAAAGVALAIAAAGVAFTIGTIGAADTGMPVAPMSDGSIVFLDGDRLMVTDAGGGAARPLLSPETLRAMDGPGNCPPSRCGAPSVFAASPDGSKVIFAWGDPRTPPDSEHRWDMLYEVGTSGTGVSGNVLNESGFVNSCGDAALQGVCTKIAFSPDGDTLAYMTSNRDLWTTRIGSQGGSRVADSVIDFAWAPSGRELAFVRPSGEVRVASVTEGSVSPTEYVANGPRHLDSLAWSSNGGTLLLTSSATSSNESDVIATIDRESGERRMIVDGGQDRFLSDASWSPDGRRITWAAFPGRQRFGGPGGPFEVEIWVSNADGSGARRVYATGCCAAGMIEHAFTGPTFSPDGTSIAFSVIGDREDPPNDTGVLVVNLDGSDVRQVSQTGIFPAWQPLPEEG